MSPDSALTLLFSGVYALQLATLGVVVGLVVKVARVELRMDAFETPEGK